jgi:uncharacterized FlgJ-related protein
MIYKIDKTTLQIQSVFKRIILITVISTLLGSSITYLLTYRNVHNTVMQSITPEETLIILNNYDKFTPEKFYQYLHELNVPYPDIVYAQAVLETGNFTSHIFKANNNLFGMKVATIRPTTNIGEENGHAAFKTWRHSVVDYAFYSSCYLTRMNRTEYLDYLSKRYAEDPKYIVRIKDIISKLAKKK